MQKPGTTSSAMPAKGMGFMGGLFTALSKNRKPKKKPEGGTMFGGKK